MENLNYIIGVGAIQKDLVMSNLREAENFRKHYDLPAFILTPRTEHYKDIVNVNGVRLVSYSLISKLTAPATTVIDNREELFLNVLKVVLESNQNCLFIIDLFVFDFPIGYDFTDCLSLIEEFRVKNNLHIVLNIKNFSEIDVSKLKYTCIKSHGDNFSQFRQLIELFGELDGLGIFLTEQLLAKYQFNYKGYCSEKKIPIDYKIANTPIYYSNSSISISWEVFNQLMPFILEENSFIEHTIYEIAEIFKINI